MQSLSGGKNLRHESGPSAIYLYCIGSSSLLQTVDGMGLDEEYPLMLFLYRELAAIVSLVKLSDFCGASARCRMEELEWIGPRACRHEQIVEEVMRSSPIMPLRFGTVFHSYESLEERLSRHHNEILPFLLRVADKEEWAIKGLISQKKTREIFSTQQIAEAAMSLSPSPGIRHFQEQRLRLAVDRRLNQWLQEMSEKIADDLSDLGIEICMRKIFPRGFIQDDRDMFLNWASLVPKHLTGDMHARFDRANAEYAPYDVFFGITGPWPPYSFCPPLDDEA